MSIRRPFIVYDDPLYWDRHASLALQSGTENPDHPLDNLRAPEPSIYHAVTEAAATWRVGMGIPATEQTDTAVVVGLPPDLVSVSYDLDLAGSPAVVAADPRAVVAGATGKLLSYWRAPTPALTEFWDVAATGGSAGLYAGRLMLGKAFEPSGDFLRFEWAWLDEPGSFSVPESGIRWTGQAIGRRLCRYTWENLTEDEAHDEASLIWRRAGTWLPVFVGVDDRPEWTVYGKLTRQPITNQSGLYWQLTVEVEEAAAG